MKKTFFQVLLVILLVYISATAQENIQVGTIRNMIEYAPSGIDQNRPLVIYSYTWNIVTVGTYTLTAVATDNSGNKTTSDAITIKVNIAQGPYNGTAHAIPSCIEAEYYDGEGVAYLEANTNGNQGGAILRNDEVDIETTTDATGTYNIAYILNGEWLEYLINVTRAGIYNLDLRVATSGDGKILHVEIDEAISVPNTGGWQTVTVNNLNLTASQDILRIAFDFDYLNVSYVEFQKLRSRV